MKKIPKGFALLCLGTILNCSVVYSSATNYKPWTEEEKIAKWDIKSTKTEERVDLTTNKPSISVEVTFESPGPNTSDLTKDSEMTVRKLTWVHDDNNLKSLKVANGYAKLNDRKVDVTHTFEDFVNYTELTNKEFRENVPFTQWGTKSKITEYERPDGSKYALVKALGQTKTIERFEDIPGSFTQDTINSTKEWNGKVRYTSDHFYKQKKITENWTRNIDGSNEQKEETIDSGKYARRDHSQNKVGPEKHTWVERNQYIITN